MATKKVARNSREGRMVDNTLVKSIFFANDKFADWTDTDGHPERELTRDEMLDDITLHWLTNTAISAARLCWENKIRTFSAVNVSIPAAVSVFPGEIY